MGALITEGEKLYRKWEKRPEATLSNADAATLQADVTAYLISTDPVITDAIGDDRLPQAPDDADWDELLVRVREAIDALYVVRDERGRAADAA